MKKTYKTFNGENRTSFVKIGEVLVDARFTPTYTTDNEFVQKAIEDSFAFKAGEIQLVTSFMQWIKIDRDENGFATEECLSRIEEYYENYTPIVIAFDNYCQDYAVITAASKLDAWLNSIRINTSYTHYLPIPKLEYETENRT